MQGYFVKCFDKLKEKDSGFKCKIKHILELSDANLVTQWNWELRV